MMHTLSFGKNADQIFELYKPFFKDLMSLNDDEIIHIIENDVLFFDGEISLNEVLMRDFSDTPATYKCYKNSTHHMGHIDIKGISRKLALSIINKYVDKIGITQQSLRRVTPRSFQSFDGNLYEVMLGYLKYHWCLYHGVEKENARELLHVDTATNLFITGSADIIKEIIDILFRADAKCEDDDIFNDYHYVNTDKNFKLTIENSYPAILGSCSVYNIDPESKGFEYIENIVDMGHMSILEHIVVVVESEMSISALNQLIRHRHKELNYDDTNVVSLGDVVPFTLITNMREACSIIGERTCSRAQSEIREMADTMRDVILSIGEYKYMNKHMGAKCQLGIKCNEPCDRPRVGESREVSIGQLNLYYPEGPID